MALAAAAAARRQSWHGRVRPPRAPHGSSALAALPPPVPEALAELWRLAKERRAPWEPLWRQCYENALPRAGGRPPGEAAAAPYDGTAALAASQLAASAASARSPRPVRAGAALSPPLAWGRRNAPSSRPPWIRPSVSCRSTSPPPTWRWSSTSRFWISSSPGRGRLLAEAAPPGGPSALRFQSVPLAELALAPGEEGDIGAVFRRRVLSVQAAARRWPAAAFLMHGEDRDGGTVAAVESVRPEGAGWLYDVFLDGEGRAARRSISSLPVSRRARSSSSAGRGPTATSGGARRS